MSELCFDCELELKIIRIFSNMDSSLSIVITGILYIRICNDIIVSQLCTQALEYLYDERIIFPEAHSFIKVYLTEVYSEAPTLATRSPKSRLTYHVSYSASD